MKIENDDNARKAREAINEQRDIMKAALAPQNALQTAFDGTLRKVTAPVQRAAIAPGKTGLPATVRKIDFHRHDARQLQKRHGESLGQMLVRTCKKR